jgi:hypothetical protein
MASSILLYLALPFWPPPHRNRRPRTYCVNNLKQIGMAFKTWALDHTNDYPFNVSTNEGGARELCAAGPDGFAANGAPIFQVMSNELSTPLFLVCSRDTLRIRATNFSNLQPSNISYRVRLGTNINESNPRAVLAVCPIHGSILYCDGSVKVMDHAPPEPHHPNLQELALLYSPLGLGVGFVLLIVGMVLEVAARR